MHINTHLDVDVVAIESDDTVTVMLELEAPPAPETGEPRPEHTAIVVLDRSGSMSGPRLAHAKRGLIDLVDRLDDRDRFGLVIFDNEAEVAIPAGKVVDLGRDRLRRDITAVRTRGMTDLSSGYLRGLQEARRVATDTGATLVLLSDGHANSGETDPTRLEGVAHAAAGQQVTTSTIGIGMGYDESILAALAKGGSGNHTFAHDGDAAAAAVAGELEGLLSKTVQAASLLIKPSSDVQSVAVLNDLPTHVVENGIQAELGDFYSGERRRLLVTIGVPVIPALGLATVADLTLTYVQLPELEQHVVTIPVAVNVVPADLAADRVPKPEVERERLLLEVQRAKEVSEEALRYGDLTSAAASLHAASSRLAAAPPSLVDDELRDEADWLTASADMVSDGDVDRSSRRLRSDRLRKSRGHKSRRQGGEVT